MIDSVTIRRTPGMLMTRMDDDVVILSLHSNCYVTLDRFGRQIWELIEEPISLVELVARLEQYYDAEPGRIRRDVEVFLREIAGDGLVSFTTG
jgi:hypothetical protein